MRIASVDDFSKDGEYILSSVRTEFAKYGISVSTSDYYPDSNSFFKSWSTGMYRIIFLDIYLNQEDGIRLAKMIRQSDPKVLIVFCSSSNEFAQESYAVQANYYLVKPVQPESIQQMVSRLNLLKAEDDMIELPRHRMFLLSQFIYSDYYNHQITIYQKNGTTEKFWSSQASLKKMLEPFDYFLQVNPGTIINLKEVIAQEGDLFKMSNGCLVSINLSRRKELIRQYQDYLFTQLRQKHD